MRITWAACAAGFLAVATSVPAAADAATVGAVDPCPRSACGGPYWVFTAAPGEVNELSATHDGTYVHVRDTQAVLEAATGCTAVTDHEVTCNATPAGIADTGDRDDRVTLTAGRVELGDGNDELDGSPSYANGGPGHDTMVAQSSDTATYLRWSGGPGNDLLQATDADQTYSDEALFAGDEGDDILLGAGGADELDGGAGNDIVRGNAGDDVLADTESPGDDLLDGGDGHDWMSYHERPGPVSLNLTDPAPDGGQGENDQLISIESGAGGGGDDLLVGDSGDNTLAGGPGHDVFIGGEGKDTLEGGEGFDRFYAGGGNDVIEAFAAEGVGTRLYYRLVLGKHMSGLPAHLVTDPTDEPVDCGEGSDTVRTYLDDPGISCEAAPFEFSTFPLRPLRRRAGRITFELPCPRRARVRRRCAGRITVQNHRDRYRRKFSVGRRGGTVTLAEPQRGGTVDPAPHRIRLDVDYAALPFSPCARQCEVRTYLTLDEARATPR